MLNPYKHLTKEQLEEYKKMEIKAVWVCLDCGLAGIVKDKDSPYYTRLVKDIARVKETEPESLSYTEFSYHLYKDKNEGTEKCPMCSNKDNVVINKEIIQDLQHYKKLYAPKEYFSDEDLKVINEGGLGFICVTCGHTMALPAEHPKSVEIRKYDWKDKLPFIYVTEYDCGCSGNPVCPKCLAGESCPETDDKLVN